MTPQKMPSAQSPETKPRIAVIAGATGNVGSAAATVLARLGFRVVTLGRSKERLEELAQSTTTTLREQTPDFAGDLIPLEVDLTDLDSVSNAANTIIQRFGAVDVLILSAVTFTQDGPTILPDGNELVFSTNVLGPFRLAKLLKPSIEAAQGVIIHDIAPFQRDIDWDDLQSIRHHKSMQAYERTKTCHRIVAGEMARRWGDRCSSVAFDPGFVIDPNDPDLRKRWPSGLTGLIWRLNAAVAAKSPSIAGQAIAGLVTRAPDRGQIKGAYYKLTKRQDKPDPSMSDPELGSRLWAALDALAFPDAEDEPLA